jgi:hypothetical protein
MRLDGLGPETIKAHQAWHEKRDFSRKGLAMNKRSLLVLLFGGLVLPRLRHSFFSAMLAIRSASASKGERNRSERMQLIGQ